MGEEAISSGGHEALGEVTMLLDVAIARSPADLATGDALVVPGVGAARPAMDRLREGGFVEPILAWIRADRPYLGICLGLQLLFDGSDEDGATTLGVIPGRTTRLREAPTLPHIGFRPARSTASRFASSTE